MNGKWIVAPWFAALGIIAYKSFNDHNGLPFPARIVRANIPFTLLAFLAEASPPLAVSLGWGLVVAVLLNNPAALSVTGAAAPNTHTPTPGGLNGPPGTPAPAPSRFPAI